MPNDYDYILGQLMSGERVPLLRADRRRHVYIVGQTGTGKTGLLLNLMHADMMGGGGFCFLDPHGDACKTVAGATPKARMNDVIYLDPCDATHTFAYNPLAGVPEAERATTAANIVSAFKNIWSDSWGPRLEYVLSNSLRLLLDVKDQSLIGIPRLFVNEAYRTWLARRCQDPLVKFFWLREFAALDARQRAEVVSPIQNKIGILLSNPFIRSILCQNSSTIDIKRIMDGGKVLIVNLSKGNLGTEPAHLLGAFLITAFAQTAEGRRNIPEDERRDFTLYADEFQNFATDSFASILSEARKWRLSLVAVNQHVSQLPESSQHAIFGNVGTIVAFRVGAMDAPKLAAELGMESPRALRETKNFQAWVRLMRGGMSLEARPMDTFDAPLTTKALAQVVARSQTRHTFHRQTQEERRGDLFVRTIGQANPLKQTNRRPD